LALAFVNASATAVWAPTGIALAAVLIFGPRIWPGILVGAFVVNATTAGSITTSLAIAIGNTSEALIGAALVNRFAGGHAAFTRGREFFLFVVLAGLLSTTVSATIGVTTLALSGLASWAGYGSIWLTWWLGDATGAVVVAPALVLWHADPRIRWSRAQCLEALLLLLGLAVLGWITFVMVTYPLGFLCLPLCVWIGFRFGAREAATATDLLAVIAVWGTARGFGSFGTHAPNEALLLLQLFLAVTTIVSITVGTAVAERRRAEDRVGALNEELEDRVRSRTALLQTAHDDLSTSEARLAEAQEVAHIGSWEWRALDSRLWWSEELYRMCGVDRASFHTSYEVLLDLVHPEDRSRVHGIVQHALDDAQPFEFEYRMVRPDGNERIIHSKGRIVQDGLGRAVRMLGTGQDVTDQRRLGEQLQQARKLEAIGLLAGGVAHDFNNMLTVIIGYSDTVLMQIGDDKPIAADLHEIRKAAESAAALTKQLLAFSRKQRLELIATDLNTVVSTVEQMLGRTLGENIRITTTLASDLRPIQADAMQLQRVLVNLAINAREAMPGGGTLTIETTNVELTSAYVATHADVSPGRYVRLAVSDTGHGMDAETKSRLFEPFFTTKERGRGTGLGLASVYGIVRQMSGTIWVYSEPGHGTTFKLYFPETQARVEAPAPAASDGRSSHLVGREVVWLVEDERSVRAFAAKVLRRYGYHVQEAETPAQALALADRQDGPIHLLLTDVIMPEMNGYELANRFCAARPQTRVLFMSGYTDQAMRQHSLSIDGPELLEKPFTATTLLQTVREVLDDQPSEVGVPRQRTRGVS
jgi:PAS domain S-box-containing protein